MAEESAGQIPVARRTLLVALAGALLAASVVVVCFVLPAEFRIDPTGLGRATGLIRLAGARELTAEQAAQEAGGTAGAGSSAGESSGTGAAPLARYYNASAPAFRSDFVDIPLASGGDPEHGYELEYKVRMKAGGTFVYSWHVSAVPTEEEFYYDLHGEAPATEEGGEPTVVQYAKATGTRSSGMLTAPLDGIFGWFLQNQSERPVVVHLRISGFYELIPPGEYGNDAGIEANRPAGETNKSAAGPRT